jgi:hypothetical protein
MNNELIIQKGWWKRNWNWLVPVSVLILLCISIFFSSGLAENTTDIAKAYADIDLYENAIEIVKKDGRVLNLLGEIKPIDKLAILEGQVEYSQNSKTVNSSIRISGTKRRATLYISADKVNDSWNYTSVQIRIKNPPEKRQELKIAIEE